MTKLEGLTMMIHGYFIANEKTIVLTEELTKTFCTDEITTIDIENAITELARQYKVKQISIHNKATKEHKCFVTLANPISYHIEI